MTKRLLITVRGSVQGVFYRWSAKERADALGITGYARNEDDGTVRIEAEGDAAALERFLEWCRRGPELARVDAVDAEDVTGSRGTFDGFIIH